jgi:hypothetical protein
MTLYFALWAGKLLPNIAFLHNLNLQIRSRSIQNPMIHSLLPSLYWPVVPPPKKGVPTTLVMPGKQQHVPNRLVLVPYRS